MTKIETQKDFFKVWSDKTGKTQKELKDVYDALVEMIQEASHAEEETRIALPKIGALITYTKAPYLFKNNLTNQVQQIGASKRSYIRLFKSFKTKL